MKIVRIILIALVVLIGLFVVVGLSLPQVYRVERSIVIAADRATIHAYVAHLERWPEWTPWQDVDPTIVTTRGDITTGVGAHQSWTGDSGTGELSFTICSETEGIAYDMSFDDGKYLSTASMLYKDVDGGTEISWVMEGDSGNNIVARFFGAMMDRWVGKDFANGLGKLKKVVEGSA